MINLNSVLNSKKIARYTSYTTLFICTIFVVFSTFATENINVYMATMGFHEVKNEEFNSHVSNTIYFVSLEKNGKLKIDNLGVNSAPSSQLTIGDVQYIGVDNGEWGGDLSVKKGEEEQEILTGNIVDLHVIDNKLYVFEGLAHGMERNGSIWSVDYKKSPYKADFITLLPDNPLMGFRETVNEYINKITFLSPRGIFALVIIEGRPTLEIISWSQWRDDIGSNSIVLINDWYFVGSFNGIIAVSKTGKDTKFFIE